MNGYEHVDPELTQSSGAPVSKAAKSTSAISWQVPMGLIAWGLILMGFRPGSLLFASILSAAGAALLYAGFRLLRQKNKCFRATWLCSLIWLHVRIVYLIVLATPAVSLLNAVAISKITLLFQAAIFVLFFLALKEFGTKANCALDAKPPLFAAVWMIAALLGLLSLYAEGFFAIAMIAILLWIAIEIYGIGKHLTKAGHTLSAIQSRVSPPVILCLYLLTTLVAALLSCVRFNHLPAKGQAFLPPETTALREQLTTKGFPSDILSRLIEADISPFERSVAIETRTQSFDLSDPYDNPLASSGSLVMTTVFIELPGSVMYVVQSFAWQGGSPYYQDGIKVWCGSLDYATELVSSGLFYTRKDVQYKSDFSRLSLHSFTETSSSEILGALSFPFGSANQEGYVLYRCDLPANQPSFSFSAMISYLHMRMPFSLPYQHAEDRLLSNEISSSDLWQHDVIYNSSWSKTQIIPMPG